MVHRAAFWLFTSLLMAWLIVGGVFDLTHAVGATEILRKLGYPEYLGSILGVGKLLAVPALLYPEWPTLQEWAYAGIAFDGLGAFFSHVAIRDGAGATIAPLVFLAFAGISYSLRPVLGVKAMEFQRCRR
ncbi:MAG: DoxX family protein [Terracidiphilus sp.]